MGSIRTWSLAAVAGIFVMVVAHQRSNAGVGQPGPADTPPAAAVPAPVATPARVTGLPDFSALVAEAGASVVNVSVTEKPQKVQGINGAAPDGDDPLSQFFHRFNVPVPHPENAPPAAESVLASSSVRMDTCSPMHTSSQMRRR